MNFKQDYKNWIAEKRKEWVGKKVAYEGKQYTVVDVDLISLHSLQTQQRLQCGW